MKAKLEYYLIYSSFISALAAHTCLECLRRHMTEYKERKSLDSCFATPITDMIISGMVGKLRDLWSIMKQNDISKLLNGSKQNNSYAHYSKQMKNED